MFSIAFQELTDRVTDQLVEEAQKISIRGNSTEVSIPAELRGTFLPVNLLANTYCSTERYVYLASVLKKKPEYTWDRFMGYTVDDIYPKMLEEFKTTKFVRLSKNGIYDACIKIGEEIIGKAKEKLERKYMKKFIFEPTTLEIKNFFNNLHRIVEFESLMAASLLDYKLSQNPEVQVNSCIEEIFPFIVKQDLHKGQEIGFSDPVQPDFIYNNKVIGDVKSGIYKDFFPHTLAAYSLAYEKNTGKNMDFGVILNPQFPEKDLTIDYSNAKIIVIDDTMRKDFLKYRNYKLNMVKNKEDRPLASEEICKRCGYYNICRGEHT